MATLQKFKILATQCGVAQSPTRSPRTSPLVQLPRKKTTLRMLLSRSASSRCREITLPAPKEITAAQTAEKQRESRALIVQSRNKLRDLFVSSFEEKEDKVSDDHKIGRDNAEALREMRRLHGHGGEGEPGLSRPVWVGFRHRFLMRKGWRPLLASIPE